MDQQLRGAYLLRVMFVTGRPLFNALSGNYICTDLVPDMLVIHNVSDIILSFMTKSRRLRDLTHGFDAIKSNSCVALRFLIGFGSFVGVVLHSGRTFVS